MSQTQQSGPILPDVRAMQAYRNRGNDILISTAFGAFIGNFVGGTIAGAMLHNPWWFGKPFLPAKAVGIPIYSLMPVVVTALKHSASHGAMQAVVAAGATFTACTLPMFALGLRKAKRAKDKIYKSDIHGSAHWANRQEIEKAALLPDPNGDNRHVCYVGGWVDPKSKKMTYLQHSGPEHIIGLAPTRSGKGVGLVIPTLLAWRGSAVVYDVKGENFELTAGWRASVGQRTLRFSPTEPWRSCHFNPLLEIRKGTQREISDAQNIATMIVDPDGKGMADHWAKTGYALLVGVILHVLYCREIEEKTLASVASLLSRPAIDDDDDEEGGDPESGPNLSGVDAVFKEMMEYDHNPPEYLKYKMPDGTITNTHRVIAESAQEMLNKASNEKSGVISTAMSFLSLYRDPMVASVVSKSDFHITDLMNDDHPYSLYIVPPPADKDRLKPLIRLMISQIIRRLTEKMEFKDGRSVASYKHRLLLLIDEFPSLGKIQIVEEALAYIAGYGIKAYLICQDRIQLQAAYSNYESVMSNCHVRIYYATNQQDTAKYVSDQLGKMTITSESHSVSYAGAFMPYQSGSSSAIQHQARDLMTPDEVGRMRGPEKNKNGDIVAAGEMVIVPSGSAPIRGTQILYFFDPVFSRRAKMPAPEVGDYLKTRSENPGGKQIVETQPDPVAPAVEPVIEVDQAEQAELDDLGVSIGAEADDFDDSLPPDDELPPDGSENDEPVETEMTDEQCRSLLDEAGIEAGKQVAARVQQSQDTFKPSEESHHKSQDKAQISSLF
ncbi:type IV secretory system conjugative DNA transfer family protein [Acidiphilium sp. PM]|uniref:type IV secretory system conjugative DNA transfer family protein n=1 Tax=Acidiphilium sp. PM TaxID=1043206 RepID=UPI0002145155|nr:type IV secretory system conjugative DNA transfer family protein [Acidiphilium sp. PM]EGO94284.1 TRAG family protein [Acidiphilium sp. PM]